MLSGTPPDNPDPQTTQTPRQTRPPRGGADWAGGLPRGRGASAAPAPLAAAGGGLGVPRGVPCSSRRVADDRTAFDVPGPGRRLIAREREVKSDQTRAPSGRGQGGGCWVLIKRRAKSEERPAKRIRIRIRIRIQAHPWPFFFYKIAHEPRTPLRKRAGRSHSCSEACVRSNTRARPRCCLFCESSRPP